MGYQYWPPGPDESDKWGRILAERPDLAPAVANPGNIRPSSGKGHSEPGKDQANPDECGPQQEDDGNQEAAECDIRGMADGSPDWLVECNSNRNERLQGLGNGVVPITGAIALVELFTRLTGINPISGGTEVNLEEYL